MLVQLRRLDPGPPRSAQYERAHKKQIPAISLNSKPDTSGGLALRRWPALLLLAAGLVVTVIAVRYTQRNVLAAARIEFEFAGHEISAKVKERLHEHEQILRNGVAFFVASESVTRAGWRAFVQHLQMDQQLPGIQGMGYAMLIPPERLAQHLQEIRQEGFAGYRVWPEGRRAVYTAIIYLEPFTNRNLRAFGYDMFSETVRRKAMERARDDNAAALTDKVKLVQETTTDVQAGTLMFVPVYHPGLPISTVGERRTALQGWVYSPYRMNDLIRGILGEWGLLKGKRIRLQTFDGEKPSADGLLYDSGSADKSQPDPAAVFTLQTQITYAGSRWTLLFTQSTTPAIVSGHNQVWGVAASGTCLSLLLASLVHSLRNTRYNARRLALRLTADLQRTTERLALATEAGGVGIWDYEVATNTLVWDDQMFRLYGITRARFSGAYEAWQTGVHPEDQQRGDAEIQGALRGEKEFNTDFRVLWPDRTVRHIRAVARVQRNVAGQPVRMLGTNWDITELKLAEEALRESKLFLLRTLATERELSALKSNFVNMVSHEFRTPLGAILGATEMLEDYYDRLAPEKRVWYFDMIRREIQRLAGMLQDMLLQGQLEAGQVQFKPRATNVVALCREIVARAQTAFRQHPPVHFEDNAPALPTLADESLLERVLSNLLSNAFKYSPALTPVRFIVRRVGNEWEIQVQDQGIGISEVDQATLFSAFRRGGNVGSIKGTGVGLYIVKRCAELHGGRVEVRSQTGQGSTFVFAFPWQPAENVSTATT